MLLLAVKPEKDRERGSPLFMPLLSVLYRSGHSASSRRDGEGPVTFPILLVIKCPSWSSFFRSTVPPQGLPLDQDPPLGQYSVRTGLG